VLSSTGVDIGVAGGAGVGIGVVAGAEPGETDCACTDAAPMTQNVLISAADAVRREAKRRNL